MTTYVSLELRRVVTGRANRICEYCLIHEADTWLGCQVDHVISEKHGGQTAADNLAYACVLCNQRKGTDLGSISASGKYVRFFNPRLDRWEEHFRLAGAVIVPLREIGEVTERIFQLNVAERLVEREALQAIGRYPPKEATARFKQSER